MCADIHRSRISMSLRKRTAMTSCPNWLCFCPGLGHGTTAARECLNIERGECDLLFVKRWVAFHNLLWSCSLTQHVRYQLDRNPCPPVDRRAAHSVRIRNNHLFCALESLQVPIEFRGCVNDGGLGSAILPSPMNWLPPRDRSDKYYTASSSL